MQYILLPPPTCFSVPTLLTPVTVTIRAQCIPTKLVLYVSCLYHLMSVYILCTSTKCRLCTTPVVSLPLLPHNPPPSPLPISTRRSSSRWVPPYVPWFCLRFLPDFPFFLPVLPLCLH